MGVSFCTVLACLLFSFMKHVSILQIMYIASTFNSSFLMYSFAFIQIFYMVYACIESHTNTYIDILHFMQSGLRGAGEYHRHTALRLRGVT